MDYYLVTIKTRGYAYTTKEELDNHYDRMVKVFNHGADWSSFCCYEITAKGRRLHLHTILALPKNTLYYPQLKLINSSRIYGHIKSFPEEDYEHVVDYIYKQQENIHDLQQILIRNEYYHKYGFLD